MAMLEVRDLHVAFPRGKRDEVEALRGVDLRLEKGERLGVVGESGAGKSMLAFAILNLIAEPGRVSGGTIKFHGDNLLELSERKIRKLRGNRISMIFQDPMVTLNPVMTIGAQMIETLQAHRRISKSEAHKLCVEKLRMVAIPSAENRMTSYPHELSGGLRQRVVIFWQHPLGVVVFQFWKDNIIFDQYLNGMQRGQALKKTAGKIDSRNV